VGAAVVSAGAGADADKSAEAGVGAPDFSVSDMGGVFCDVGGSVRMRG
jgi:hypothetical protein